MKFFNTPHGTICVNALGNITVFGCNGFYELDALTKCTKPIKTIVSLIGWSIVVLYEDGTISLFGNDKFNLIPILNNLTDVADIYSSVCYIVIVKNDGSINVFGNNNYKCCNVPHGVRGVVSMICYTGHAIALLDNGTVVGWGRNFHEDFSYLNDIVSIEKYYENIFVATKTDGSIVISGYCLNPKLDVAFFVGAKEFCGDRDCLIVLDNNGDAFIHDFIRDNVVKHDNVKSLSYDGSFAFILKNDGTFVVVKYGNEPDYCGVSNVPRNLTDVEYINVGSSVLAIKTDGSVVCWGCY